MKQFSVTFLPTSDLVAQSFRASLPGLCRAESPRFEAQTNRTTFSPRTVSVHSLILSILVLRTGEMLTEKSRIR